MDDEKDKCSIPCHTDMCPSCVKKLTDDECKDLPKEAVDASDEGKATLNRISKVSVFLKCLAFVILLLLIYFLYQSGDGFGK